ncbi:cytoplasm protein [Capsaspora owczarzaki ATCC 30864]|uniref:Cytoplasm protein n=1 Tax=Capsaspora owczarzaki (strain ATCC 30864) TaxID=595528 RepID=A0A0D2VFD5_CAPO3|nr:cytoplasm protein [Capsaspora owczarzaki ATCC 30864]KJE88437.1 cytoplasm protein [Capsaspora owczarzaki ATCC 30864]|eukprot:XP_004364965.2 cytoplasm protein [Capsaspora owczarzaki ATCC 30864]
MSNHHQADHHPHHPQQHRVSFAPTATSAPERQHDHDHDNDNEEQHGDSLSVQQQASSSSSSHLNRRASPLLAADAHSPEITRLRQDAARTHNWKRWGPYLSERQWATVREDYSSDGNCWKSFPHDHARSRAYRWGEDGLLGITDRECRLCFALALWNGKDPILKERLFGLTGPEGNHGEDVKECYYYLDSTPTHSYMKALYKYPQGEYPYSQLVDENRRRGVHQREFELEDAGVFADGRYWDVQAEYAKEAEDDILIRITVTNRGPEAARLHVLPTLWFRNTWVWGCTHEGCTMRPTIRGSNDKPSSASSPQFVRMTTTHETLQPFEWEADVGPNGALPETLFTENISNSERLWNLPNDKPYVKDSFHRYVINNEHGAVNPKHVGTKAAVVYALDVPAGEQQVLRLRLRALGTTAQASSAPFGQGFDEIFARRINEANEFYQQHVLKPDMSDDNALIARQAYAGLLWTKQFFHYIVRDWLTGDPNMLAPPSERMHGRNHDWQHFFARDVLSMPDKWEYPWFACWDLAFHMIPFAKIDPEFAKHQLSLMLREWYMHPNGQLPAYEFAFDDVNPPVHAWAVWRVYKMSGTKGSRDLNFLTSCFVKLMLNFNWWVNRKDKDGNHVFSGGFLGLDNIGVFDRSKPLPTGGSLQQADGTAWMAFFCVTMLDMALELAQHNPAFEDIASKFFEHFVAITDAMNHLGGSGLWDESDGFYYDKLQTHSCESHLRIRSMVGLIPLYACLVLEPRVLDKLKGFTKRLNWFLRNRKDLAKSISYLTPRQSHGAKDSEESQTSCDAKGGVHLLAIPSRERLERVLKVLLDEDEFLSPHGIRSLSRVHERSPFTLNVGGEVHRVDFAPAESTSYLFGGNSNWRGPIWLPVNYLLIEALERYHYFYGSDLMVECPTGSGDMMNLKQVAQELSRRLTSLFVSDENGRRPCHGDNPLYANDPHWKDLVLFYEYFDALDGRGIGASHQTGWTALVARCLDKI